ncbi:adenine deaminase C-terminal domain-containing protein [Bacillus kwashiorkori]|uniref:adenine deaminase C-terminal domain-containing protein n=1 Tax=Bacillus kwashiorkori TaxID=1522318 RepID=UPI0007863239|nr:adenine deaminase C-terminal domain-containing protein [Bacillus kwashiorkori]
MLTAKYKWRTKQLREHVEVLNGKKSPTILLYNATYLNGILKRWMKANIWIYEDRIIYVGDKLPELVDPSCEKIDCSNQYLVPGYIEPHAHPFQLYNPQTFAQYASLTGTTTLINDNLTLALLLKNENALSFIEKINDLPVTMYWWCRYDGQTEIINEDAVFSHSNVKSWLSNSHVLQGGELTGWPKLLAGDDLILHWIQETKRLRKRVEGHFPGASEKTLAKLMLLGADSDHEAMTGEEVMRRMMHGYMVSLRYSSIRPDLPTILDDLAEYQLPNYDQFMLTTDGSPPSFYENGVMDRLINLAISKGVPAIEAYQMATANPAKYYQIDHYHGFITTGRVANINFLTEKENPTPISVLAKGKWIKREHFEQDEQLDWQSFGFSPLQIDWELTMNDLQFSMPLGIRMENSVITKPYSVTIDASRTELDPDIDESFFLLIDKHGKWRVSTILKGFAKNVSGFASSFSNTGDIIVIGKNKQAMMEAFNKMKELGGGIVMVEKGQSIFELPLPLGGVISDLPFQTLIEKEKKLKQLLMERGYSFADPIYTLLFFSSTHLPYIRITQQGLFDVMKKTVLIPAIMR